MNANANVPLLYRCNRQTVNLHVLTCLRDVRNFLTRDGQAVPFLHVLANSNRPNCTFARPSLVRVTDHIRRKEDHQGTIFGQYPNRPDQCLGVHVATHPAPLPHTSFAYMVVAKATIDERYGIFNLFIDHDDDAWNGFMEAYVHANSLVSVAGHNFFDDF
ncbi:hypothetical protein niasHS_008909 [Heterodera schachtii]|uniref:Uncharacterized protein n=1 Tax=Heterodera schachtii TaxID=97005 RepID=A0ABD2J3D7_HETSC